MPKYQDEIADYIKYLLDKTKKLDTDVETLKRDRKTHFGPPPVPYAGMSTALDPQRHDVVKIYYTNPTNNYWEGQLCKPTESNPFWIPDADLGTISGITPDMVSVPEIDEIVEVFFSGMYGDSANLQPQYGMFDVADARPGFTTSYLYPYPEDEDTNVYEVLTLKARFPKVPGHQDYSAQSKDVVMAMNWVDNPVLLPQGTKVTVHRHNGQWWFRQRTASTTTTSTSSGCVITVIVSAYCSCDCDCCSTWVSTCTYVNTYTYVTSCTTNWDPFNQTYITSCTTTTSITTITSCSTYASSGGNCNCSISAVYTIGADCR